MDLGHVIYLFINYLQAIWLMAAYPSVEEWVYVYVLSILGVCHFSTVVNYMPHLALLYIAKAFDDVFCNQLYFNLGHV